MKNLIRKKLKSTSKCKSKKALLTCLVGKGYAIVDIKEFSESLAKEIEDYLKKGKF